MVLGAVYLSQKLVFSDSTIHKHERLLSEFCDIKLSVCLLSIFVFFQFTKKKKKKKKEIMKGFTKVTTTPSWKNKVLISSAVTSVIAYLLYAFSTMALALRKPHKDVEKGADMFIVVIITATGSLIAWVICSVLVCIGKNRGFWDLPTKVVVSQLILMVMTGAIAVVVSLNHNFSSSSDVEKRDEANSQSRGMTIMYIIVFNIIVLIINGIVLCATVRCCLKTSDLRMNDSEETDEFSITVSEHQK